MANLTNQRISDTYQYVLQVSGGLIQDGLGGTVTGTIESLSATNGFTGSLDGIAASASFALTASFLSGTFDGTASYALTASYLSGSSETSSYALTASVLDWNSNVYEIHVSDYEGVDTTGSYNGSELYPYKTVEFALSQSAAGSRIIIHRGQYNESVFVTTPNLSFVGYEAGNGSLVEILGTFAVSSSTASTRISNIRLANLTHQDSGSLFILNTTVTGNVSLQGPGYVEVSDSRIAASSISVTGPSTVIVQNSTFYPLIQNNADSIVLLRGIITTVSPTISAGNFSVVDSLIQPATSGSAAISSSPGSIVQLLNTQITTATGIPERINIGGFLAYDNIVFNKAASTLGTSLNTTARFQNVEAVSFTGSFTGSFEGTASRAVSSSFAVSSSYASNSAFFNDKDLAYFINTGSTNVTQSITGSLVITQNLTVLGSSSFVYVTASQVLVDQNTLTVYANGLGLPTAGYIVADSSSTYSSSAFLYNIVDEKWSLDRPLSASLEGTASWAHSASVTANQAYSLGSSPSSSGITPYGITSNTASQLSDIILGGDGNITGEAGGVGTSYSTIVNGQTNTITAANYSTVVGGDINTITSGSDYSLVNGTNNTIINSNYSTVLGNTNTISGSSTPTPASAILGGENNQILDSRAALAFGNSALISSSDWATAIGRNVTVQGKDYAHVIGYNLTASYDNALHVNNLFVSGTIYGTTQKQAYIKGVSASSSGVTPVGNTTNTASAATDVILGGINNKIVNGAFTGLYNFIANGEGNRITGSGYANVLGRDNQVQGVNYPTAIGYGNIISGSNTQPAGIALGNFNNVSTSSYSIAMGYLNTISNTSHSSVIGFNSKVVGKNSAHVIGSNLSASYDNTLHVENLYVSGTIYGYRSGGGATVTISGSTPSGSLESGSLWWNETDGNLYIQVTSPTGSTYVPTTSNVIASISSSYAATASIATSSSFATSASFAATASVATRTTRATVGLNWSNANGISVFQNPTSIGGTITGNATFGNNINGVLLSNGAGQNGTVYWNLTGSGTIETFDFTQDFQAEFMTYFDGPVNSGVHGDGHYFNFGGNGGSATGYAIADNSLCFTYDPYSGAMNNIVFINGTTAGTQPLFDSVNIIQQKWVNWTLQVQRNMRTGNRELTVLSNGQVQIVTDVSTWSPSGKIFTVGAWSGAANAPQYVRGAKIQYI